MQLILAMGQELILATLTASLFISPSVRVNWIEKGVTQPRRDGNCSAHNSCSPCVCDLKYLKAHVFRPAPTRITEPVVTSSPAR
jgi:hypothetical protein